MSENGGLALQKQELSGLGYDNNIMIWWVSKVGDFVPGGPRTHPLRPGCEIGVFHLSARLSRTISGSIHSAEISKAPILGMLMSTIMSETSQWRCCDLSTFIQILHTQVCPVYWHCVCFPKNASVIFGKPIEHTIPNVPGDGGTLM